MLPSLSLKEEDEDAADVDANEEECRDKLLVSGVSLLAPYRLRLSCQSAMIPSSSDSSGSGASSNNCLIRRVLNSTSLRCTKRLAELMGTISPLNSCLALVLLQKPPATGKTGQSSEVHCALTTVVMCEERDYSALLPEASVRLPQTF